MVHAGYKERIIKTIPDNFFVLQQFYDLLVLTAKCTYFKELYKRYSVLFEACKLPSVCPFCLCSLWV